MMNKYISKQNLIFQGLKFQGPENFTSQSPMSINSANSGTDVIICRIPSFDENPLNMRKKKRVFEIIWVVSGSRLNGLFFCCFFSFIVKSRFLLCHECGALFRVHAIQQKQRMRCSRGIFQELGVFVAGNSIPNSIQPTRDKIRTVK